MPFEGVICGKVKVTISINKYDNKSINQHHSLFFYSTLYHLSFIIYNLSFTLTSISTSTATATATATSTILNPYLYLYLYYVSTSTLSIVRISSNLKKYPRGTHPPGIRLAAVTSQQLTNKSHSHLWHAISLGQHCNSRLRQNLITYEVGHF